METGYDQVPEMDSADYINLIIWSACIPPHLLARKSSIKVLVLPEKK